MHKGGRPRDIIWEHFVSVTVAGKEYAKAALRMDPVTGGKQLNPMV